MITMQTHAQQTTVNLYDGAAPGSADWTWTEKENNNNMWQTRVVYNVSKPTLTIFKPAEGKGNGTGIVIAPGGGFYALSIDSEGFDVARWLAAKGYTCFVLKYRLVHVAGNDPVVAIGQDQQQGQFDKKTTETVPLCVADGRAAIAWVRMHAKDYAIAANKIGIIGFSAGGTVAASSAFAFSADNKPDFVAPIYPFFPAQMQGKMADDAPPLFIATASNDGLGLAPHSLDLYSAWLKAGKPAEMHMYAKGDHGFGMRKQNLPSDQWIDRFGEWLAVMGFAKP